MAWLKDRLVAWIHDLIDRSVTGGVDMMERIEAFEAMLKAALEQSEAERQKMEALKAQGREKSATYRQYLGNRLFYNQLFALYRQYGLIDKQGE
jgi:hypothetical protein